jgi:hypothetical protein
MSKNWRILLRLRRAYLTALSLTQAISSIHQRPWNPFSDPGLFLSFVGKIPSTGYQPVARPRPTHKTTQAKRTNAQRHKCPEWDSNPRPQHSSGRRLFLPKTARLLWSQTDATYVKLPIAVAERSRARTVFARSNTAIVGSNPT